MKQKGETCVVPLSDIHKQSIPELLTKSKIKYSKSVLYRTVSSDLSDLANVNYDVLAFFSPSGIASLLQNFPDFKQNNTLIAAFRPSISYAVISNNL